jgi:hypothetical protein
VGAGIGFGLLRKVLVVREDNDLRDAIEKLTGFMRRGSLLAIDGRGQ